MPVWVCVWEIKHIRTSKKHTSGSDSAIAGVRYVGAYCNLGARLMYNWSLEQGGVCLVAKIDPDEFITS